MSNNARFSLPYGNCEHFRVRGEALEETLNPFQGGAEIIESFKIIAKCYKALLSNSSRYNQHTNAVLQLGTKFTDDIRFAINIFELSEIYTVIAFATFWTLGRYFLAGWVLKPLARLAGVQEKHIERLCESVWKAFAYFIVWVSAVNVAFFRSYNFFNKPMQMFEDWTPSKPQGDLAFVYALEFSFYLHCVYATFAMDVKRKDTFAMLTHHLVSMTLISLSYANRCLKIGVLIFVLNDIGDFLLEVGKIGIYLRLSKCRYSNVFGQISDISASLFAITWFTNRLWFHLSKVWRSAAFGIWASHPVLPVPFQLFLNIILGALFLLYLYWSWFIIIFVIRNLFKRERVEDPREDEEQKNNANFVKKND